MVKLFYPFGYLVKHFLIVDAVLNKVQNVKRENMLKERYDKLNSETISTQNEVFGGKGIKTGHLLKMHSIPRFYP